MQGAKSSQVTVAPCNCALNAMTVQKEVDVTLKGPIQFEIVLAKKSATNKDEFKEKE